MPVIYASDQKIHQSSEENFVEWDGPVVMVSDHDGNVHFVYVCRPGQYANMIFQPNDVIVRINE